MHKICLVACLIFNLLYSNFGLKLSGISTLQGVIGMTKASDRTRLYFWELRNKIDVVPAVNLLAQKGMVVTFAVDVVDSFVQLAVSQQLSPDPTIPFVMMNGPVRTLYQSLLQEDESFLAELEEKAGLKWAELSLGGVNQSDFNTPELITHTFNRLQADYGTHLAKNLQYWWKMPQVRYVPISLVWSSHGYEHITGVTVHNWQQTKQREAARQ